MGEKTYSDPSSPTRLLLVLLGTLFLAEALIMLLLDALPPLSRRAEAFLDAGLLAGAAFPALSLLVFRRLRQEIRGRAAAAAELARSNHRLEETVALRTRALTEEVAEREKAEARLQHEMAETAQAAGRYRLLFEEAPILCVTTRTVNGAPVVEDCSRSFHESLGYPKDEVLGRPLADFYTPESRRDLLEGGGYRRALEGTFTEERRVLVRRDGTRRATLLRARPLGNARGQATGTLAAFLDITEREQAEERFRATFEQAAVGMAHLTPDGRWVRVNRKLCEILGYEADDLVGRSFQELTHPEDLARNLELVGEVRSGESSHASLDKRYLGRDGSPVWVHLTVAPVRDGSGSIAYVVSVVEEVTERKRAETALRESERRYRHLFGQMSDFVCTHDREGRLLSANPAAASGLGYEPGEIVGRALSEFLPPEHRDSFRTQYLDRVLEAGHAEGSLVLVGKDGTRHHLDYRNRLAREEGGGEYVIGVAREVTQERRAEATLARLGAALEQVADGVLVTDAAGAIRYANPALAEITGYSLEEMRGQTPRLFRSGRHGPEYYQALWASLGRGDVWRGRFVNRRKDGTEYEEECTISPVQSGNGRTVSYVAVKRDLTERLSLERQLQESQRLETLGRLAGGVAHDFNNLLTVVLGQSELIAYGLPPGDPLAGKLEVIRHAGERAADLTRQLLAFGRRQVLDPRVLDLGKLVAGSKKMLQRLLGESVELVLDPPPGPSPVRLDPGQFSQVLLNLAANARDAMPRGGTLTLTVAREKLGPDRPTELADLAPGTYAVLTVRDTGEGMDAEIRERIFEPFFTTKEPGRGTGLGLATVYGIVKQSGGHIRVESEPGSGTAFHLYLPECRAADLPQGAEPGPRNLPLRGTEAILLVEDEQPVREMVREMLRQRGYEVLAADGPGAALLLVEQHRGPIHLLLTDVQMPLLGGVDLATRVRSVRPIRHVLYMSGYAPESLGLPAALEGGSHFLAKPFSSDTLAARVREVLDRP